MCSDGFCVFITSSLADGLLETISHSNHISPMFQLYPKIKLSWYHFRYFRRKIRFAVCYCWNEAYTTGVPEHVMFIVSFYSFRRNGQHWKY